MNIITKDFGDGVELCWTPERGVGANITLDALIRYDMHGSNPPLHPALRRRISDFVIEAEARHFGENPPDLSREAPEGGWKEWAQ